MGYTHYWEVPNKISAESFGKISSDFKKMLPPLDEMGVKLGNGHGEKSPIINDSDIIFNGIRNCNHNRQTILKYPRNNLGLMKRVCTGDCSHETFHFDTMPTEFSFCKTEHKPYDLAVNVCLVIAKNHLGDSINISSDGNGEDWIESVILCSQFLNYNYKLVSEFTFHRK